MNDRLPWFPCNPEKLLGALSGMEPHQGLLYVVLLLRVYEVGGPAREDVGTLRRRTGLSKKQVMDALNHLVSAKKITVQDGLYSNPQAEEVLIEQKEFRDKQSKQRSKAAKSRWGKTEEKQQTDDAGGVRDNAHLHLDSKKERKKESSPPAKKRKVENYTEEFETQIWEPYPRKRNTSKINAFKKYQALEPDKQQQLKASIAPFAASVRGKEEQFIPHLEFFISRRIFETVAAPAAGAAPSAQPGQFDRKTWENLSKIYASTSNWSRQWGPEPGQGGCRMPRDLQQQFVNPGLTAH